MKIGITSDHGADRLKDVLVAYLKDSGHSVVDVNPCDGERVDYPDQARMLCKLVLEHNIERGIVLCGSGIGISIAANKFNGIRCALCHDHYTAKMCREHNDANVLAIGGRVVGDEVAKDIVDVFTSTKFLQGRHSVRLDKISAIEKEQK